MIKLRQVVVVEGKYDKIRLESLIDALIIPTDGFAIFKDKDKMQMLRCLAEKNGLVIITDSDSAGFLIRNHISGCIPKEYIRHVYIPDILGKEKRKTEYSKEGKLGVEGMSTTVLEEALKKAGVVSEETDGVKEPITSADFFEDGYSGSKNSEVKRSLLKKRLELPERLTAKALLEVLNILITKDEYRLLTEEINIELNNID